MSKKETPKVVNLRVVTREPHNHPIVVRFDESLNSRMRSYMAKMDIPMAHLVRVAVREFLDREDSVMSDKK